VDVDGINPRITAVAQQFAWLTAALRRSPGKSSLSEMAFIATKGNDFFHRNGRTQGVTEEVASDGLPSGFPILSRDSQIGLELPH
jgi:hypothetical protein